MGTTVFSVDATKIYHFKVKDFGIKKDPLCLGNISWNASTNIMKEKEGLNGCAYNFFAMIKLLKLVLFSISIKN